MSLHRAAVAAFALTFALLPIARADQGEGPGPEALVAYLARPEPAFAWKLVGSESSDAGELHRIALTSQVWHDLTWTHDLFVYEPKAIRHPGPMVLFITGGSTGAKYKPGDHAMGFALAEKCGGRVAVLHQVPNQPLLGGLKEDDLISETFLRYLADGDPTWPLLLPMVKSAVKAMDALQAFGKERGREPAQFVVTGASKRGWTTWLTGATDRRVLAIAPMVIPMLNLAKQNPHQLDVWGKYSEQIDDYVRKGLMDKLGTPSGKALTRIIDPYFYISRITQPKLQINGTNDRYWTLDAMNLFFDDLPVPSYAVYLPNAGHGMEQNRDYALNGVAALYRHTVTGKPLPQFKAEHTGVNGRLRLNIDLSSAHEESRPKSVKLWTATAPTQDFRSSTWTAGTSCDLPRRGSGGTGLEADRPESGWIALFGDLTCEIDGLEYHLSTPIRVVGPKAAE